MLLPSIMSQKDAFRFSPCNVVFADSGDQLRLSDSIQKCGVWHRGVLGSQVQGRWSGFFIEAGLYKKGNYWGILCMILCTGLSTNTCTITGQVDLKNIWNKIICWFFPCFSWERTTVNTPRLLWLLTPSVKSQNLTCQKRYSAGWRN